jgi:hypothetical protein
VIALIESARKILLEENEAFNLKKKNYDDEKILQLKMAARKIAPGFLDTETRILQPQQTYKHLYGGESSGTESPNNTETSPTNSVPLGISPEKVKTYTDYVFLLTF